MHPPASQEDKAGLRSTVTQRLGWWAKRASGLLFDAVHKVDTGPERAADIVDDPGPALGKLYAYDPSPWRTLSRSLRLVRLRPQTFTFIDIGCGKGKVLLSALRLPFEHIVGVEFSPALCRIAEQNVASARFIFRKCWSVQIVCCDAARYAIPDSPAILFFYNPFPLDTLKAILGNVVASYRKIPRPVFLIFYASSSTVPGAYEFLSLRTDGNVRQRISGTLGKRTINVFELPNED